MRFFDQLRRLWKTEDASGTSEETKRRIYNLHMEEEVLFYIDDVFKEPGEKVVTVVGEWAKGNLEKKSACLFLDCDGLPMKKGKVLSNKEKTVSHGKFFREEQKNVLKIRVFDGSLETVQAAQMIIKIDRDETEKLA